MSGRLQVLDCTLRDGGRGLEDLNKNGSKIHAFTEEDKQGIVCNLRDSGIDIIEIGSISMSKEYKGLEKYAIYSNVEELSKYVPDRIESGKIYTGFYIDPDTPIENIPEYSPELVNGIRVCIRYSQLQESIDYCKGLARKGYKIFIQPMLTMRYTDDELKRLVYSANEMEAYALYFVDSFGYMNEKDVERLYRLYAEDLDKNIKIGFHAHNNMENAMGNVRFFIEKLMDRDCIVDSCAMGMGQGAGNLQTEVLIEYLNRTRKAEYNFEKILETCDSVEKFRVHDMETWGYSPVRLISAVHSVAYKYAVALRVEYGMSLVEINRVLTDVPDELRHRYTPENLKIILDKRH